MRCPNCQKTILDNIKKCPYCGHDTTKKINVTDMFENPVNPMGNMAATGAIPPAEHHEAVRTEVKKRHWQRWIFYILIIIIVLGSVGLMVQMSADNDKLILAMNQSTQNLAAKDEELAKKEAAVKQAEDARQQAQNQLNEKAEQYKKDIEAQSGAVKDLEQCKLELTASDANIYNLILTLGTGISKVDLAKIAVADANISNGVDSDTDGLSDEVELALGTDKDKADTDGDTYGDRDELLRSFDPLVAGRAMPIDQAYADKQKGRIVIAVEGNKEAWYVNPGDGKRYFLGRPGDAYKAMRSVEFWTKNYGK
jgi:hypothetical protein